MTVRFLSACRGQDDGAMQPLPDPTDFGLSPFPDCVVAVRVPADGLTVFRLVNTVPATEDDFVPRSPLRVGAHPILVTCAVSVFLSANSALSVRVRPTSRVAQLRLRPDPLTHVAHTAQDRQRDHLSVWAPKRRLLRAVIRYW
jgi:hypothetical protein